MISGKIGVTSPVAGSESLKPVENALPEPEENKPTASVPALIPPEEQKPDATSFRNQNSQKPMQKVKRLIPGHLVISLIPFRR
jgi:hypothetical protein